MKELAVGEVAEIDGVQIVCVADDPVDEVFCKECALNYPGGCADKSECMKSKRSDGIDVHFEEAKMKKFRIRLWLVKRLLESVMADRIDEFPEFDAISEGVAHLHSAIENDWPKEPVILDGNNVGVVQLLAKTGGCDEFSCGECPFDKGPHPVTPEMAKRWLREHGIKEEVEG